MFVHKKNETLTSLVLSTPLYFFLTTRGECLTCLWHGAESVHLTSAIGEYHHTQTHYIMVLGTYRGLIWNVALGTQVAPMKRDIRDLWYFNESSACTVCMKRQPTRLQLLKTFTSTALLFSERVKSNLFTEPELPVTHFNLQIELLTMLLPCILGRLYTNCTV